MLILFTDSTSKNIRGTRIRIEIFHYNNIGGIQIFSGGLRAIQAEVY